MAKLGKRQLETLAALAWYQCAMVVGSRMTKRLETLGLVEHHGRDRQSFAALTPNGLRTVADACEDGRLEWFTMPATHPEKDG